MITGMGIKAMSVRGTSIESMNMRLRTSMTKMRNTFVSCSETKFFIVSMSEVQRWMISPVRFFMCQEKGRCSIWEKAVSRMVFTSVSEALVLLTRKMYWLATLIAATATTASAMIHRCSPRYEKPPSASTRRMTQAGNSASLPPIALSIAARMICGESISARAASAAENMLTPNSSLLPFKKRSISARVSFFFCLFSCFVIVLSSFRVKRSRQRSVL